MIILVGCSDSSNEEVNAISNDISDIFFSNNDKYAVLESSKVTIGPQAKKYNVEDSKNLKVGSSVCFILEKDMELDNASFKTMDKKLNNARILLMAVTSKGASLKSGEIIPTWEFDGIGGIKREFSACVEMIDSGENHKVSEVNSISISSTKDFNVHGIYIK